jgi:uroporphyrinogen decarboxylase
MDVSRKAPMTSRLLIREIIERHTVPRTGFWLGNPHPDTWPIYHRYFGTTGEEEMRRLLHDDFRWISPQFLDTTYRHPGGGGIFDLWRQKKSLGEAGPLAGATTPREVNGFSWPDPAYLHFDEWLETMETLGEVYRASGFWAPFFHDTMDLFGVEEFMMKMHTHPDVIRAALDHVCGFYEEANRRFFAEAGNLVDGYFFGNDFGTQRDLFISPGHFDEYFLPWVQRFAENARSAGYQVLLHSCGSVERIIDRLIDAGIQCLHPLQALAGNMDAQTLAGKYQGRIAFLGGIDTQDLLVRGTPDEIAREVSRVRNVLGPHLIVSPSHEALLPNVPPENVRAMAEAALEIR